MSTQGPDTVNQPRASPHVAKKVIAEFCLCTAGDGSKRLPMCANHILVTSILITRRSTYLSQALDPYSLIAKGYCKCPGCDPPDSTCPPPFQNPTE